MAWGGGGVYSLICCEFNSGLYFSFLHNCRGKSGGEFFFSFPLRDGETWHCGEFSFILPVRLNIDLRKSRSHRDKSISMMCESECVRDDVSWRWGVYGDNLLVPVPNVTVTWRQHGGHVNDCDDNLLWFSSRLIDSRVPSTGVR